MGDVEEQAHASLVVHVEGQTVELRLSDTLLSTLLDGGKVVENSWRVGRHFQLGHAMEHGTEGRQVFCKQGKATKMCREFGDMK